MKLSILIVPSTIFCTSVLPNLMRDVEQRDHDRNSADDLSEIRQVAKIHRFQSQPSRRLRSIAPTYVDSVLELAFVLCGVEMAFRLRDQSVVADLPEFIAADPNAFARTARSGVGSS